MNVPFSELLHRNSGGSVGTAGIDQHFIQILMNCSFQPNLFHFDSLPHWCCCCTSKYSSFLSFSAKLVKSSYWFQGYENRSVQFDNNKLVLWLLHVVFSLKTCQFQFFIEIYIIFIQKRFIINQSSVKKMCSKGKTTFVKINIEVELHRPVFLTLEPILCKFCWEAEKWWVFWSTTTGNE